MGKDRRRFEVPKPDHEGTQMTEATQSLLGAYEPNAPTGSPRTKGTYRVHEKTEPPNYMSAHGIDWRRGWDLLRPSDFGR